MKKGKLLYAAVLVFLLITPNGLLAEEATESLKETYQKAEAGDADAQFNLGLMYDIGEGVPQDYKEAIKWYSRAAEQGSDRAQHNLGLMYATGEGVPNDYVLAYKWFNLAAAQGNEQAIKNRDLCKRYMSSFQIAKGQRLSREFSPRSEKFGETP